jgi:hypothetical protein
MHLIVQLITRRLLPLMHIGFNTNVVQPRSLYFGGNRLAIIGVLLRHGAGSTRRVTGNLDWVLRRRWDWMRGCCATVLIVTPELG